MPDSALTDYLILRDLEEPISESQLDAAAEQSGETLDALREEGVEIRWVDSEVMTNADGDVTGTFCRYAAEDEAAIREHGERAGLPVTRVDERGTPLDGE